MEGFLAFMRTIESVAKKVLIAKGRIFKILKDDPRIGWRHLSKRELWKNVGQ